MSDPHKWEFRPPPPGDLGEELQLCKEQDQCRLGNLCPSPHSRRELQEWKRRREIQIKSQIQKGSYSDRILKQVLYERSTLAPTAESLSGIKLVCDQPDTLTFSSRSSAVVWNFFLSSHQFLKGISLLHVENLQHFTLSEVSRVRNGNITELPYNQRECAIEESEDQSTERLAPNYHYRLKLKFSTKVFGKFKQTVLFDFGTKPLLAKTVNVLVAPESVEDDLNSAKESILTVSEVWNETNSNIIRFEPAPPKAQPDEDILAAQYPVPHPATFKLTKVCGEPGLTLENYRERFHQLLYMEEMSQYNEITGFNAALNLHITERYLLSASPSVASTAKYARPGELFGRIELNSELSDDSKAGKLILTKCSSVLIKLDQDMMQEKKKGKKKTEKKKKNQPVHSKIWECLIEDTAKSVIYVRLPAALVLDMNLQSDMRIKADVQFKLSRLSLVEMHYAVDRLSDLRIVYPNTELHPSIPWSPSHQWKGNLDPLLNLKQREAVLAITAPVSIPLPPVLIIGPYGTGKTFTLGKALEILLKEPSNRILVCTHSNSAADLYIKDYIDPATQKGNIKKKILRIYYYNRWIETVHPTVQKYCLVETDDITSIRRFKIPQYKDLAEQDLIVATLSTSRCLAQQLPVGHFTHILLDEAAQALETEAIMPLILANSTTRVVLAGDHLQLEPEVISPFSMEKRLNLSLLERLYDHYPRNFSCKILLCENYRSHEDIVSFTSDLFYEQKLVSSGKQPAHPKWFPLTFFTARGENIQDVNSTSFYNNYEVGEIVDRLIELRKHWPKIWGKKEEVEIGVVTPYHDQVMRIRAELRKKRLHNISVERVQNVQGKQYRAIFISTVRTRDSCIAKQGDRVDFGFLSSAKLLNTAVTRAQSLVAVVGDPVALCSVGRCRKLWERFLEICFKNKSLIGYTWKELRLNLEAIDLKNIYGLNPMAKEFIPRAMVYNYDRAAIPPPVPTSSNLPPWLPLGQMTPLNRLGLVPPRFRYPFLNRPIYPGMLPPSLNPSSRALTPSVNSALLPPPPPPHFLPPMLPGLRPPMVKGYSPPSPQSRFPVQMSVMAQNTNIKSAAVPPPVEGVSKSDHESAMDRILPPNTDLQTIMKSRDAQVSWYNFLKSMGKEAEALAFEELILCEGGFERAFAGDQMSLSGDLQMQTLENSVQSNSTVNSALLQSLENLDLDADRLEEVGVEDEEKDGMNSMFEYLMADFDKHDESINTPLYLRKSQYDDVEQRSGAAAGIQSSNGAEANGQTGFGGQENGTMNPETSALDLINRQAGEYEQLVGGRLEIPGPPHLGGSRFSTYYERVLSSTNNRFFGRHPEGRLVTEAEPTFFHPSSEYSFLHQPLGGQGAEAGLPPDSEFPVLQTEPRTSVPVYRADSSPPGAAAPRPDSPDKLPTYARVVMTSHRSQEEDTLTKIRNLGTFGFQNSG